MVEKILWRPVGQDISSAAADERTPAQKRLDEEVEFHRIRNLSFDEILKDRCNKFHDERSPSLIIKMPRQRPLLEIIHQSLGVGQEVALYAAFFGVIREIVSAVLLASGITSNASSYPFVSMATVVFFHPALRRQHIARRLPCSIIITSSISLATAWLLLSSFEKVIFAGLQVVIFVISPCLQWRLQRHKKIITGPWDIAHIHVAD